MDEQLSRLGVGLFQATGDGELIQMDEAAAKLLGERLRTRPVWLVELAMRVPVEGMLEEPLPEHGLTIVARREGDRIEAMVREAREPGRERELRALVERLPDGILLHQSGRIVYANPRAADLLGARDPDALLGLLLPAELEERASDGIIREVHLAPDRIVEVESLSLVFHGRETGVVIARDITERRKLQARLAQADRLAAVGTLAASVAHEVNNPLTYVLHYLDRLVEELGGLRSLDTTSAESRADLDRRLLHLADGAGSAVEGSLRVRDIVRDLKTFSRTEDGPSVPIDVNRALRSAVQMASHHIGMRARLEIDFGAIPVVRANDGRLCQVFLNLLLNAAQAIPEGAVEQHKVSVHSWSQAGLVCVAVTDTGSGIEGRNLGRLFDPFFSTKTDRGGSGLGLWISREIVHEIGGHIEVESELGSGSTFTVVLPAVVGVEAERILSSAPPPATFERRATPAQVHRILVVDDEPALRDLLAEALSERAQVLTASNGLEARELLEHDERFDMILCDLMMPAMNGVELYEWVARVHPPLATRIVFMTGAVYTAHTRDFLSRVANECLAKPFRVRDVEHVIDRMVPPRPVPVH